MVIIRVVGRFVGARLNTKLYQSSKIVHLPLDFIPLLLLVTFPPLPLDFVPLLPLLLLVPFPPLPLDFVPLLPLLLLVPFPPLPLDFVPLPPSSYVGSEGFDDGSNVGVLVGRLLRENDGNLDG
jgi:hypothetical protein